MDEALNNQNSNSNDSMPTAMGSFYESVLRKVTNVFKSKSSSDGVKQLEDLWESICAMRQQQHLNHQSQSVVESSTTVSGVKRDASKMTTSTSSPSMVTQAKKPKLTTPTPTATTTGTTKTNTIKSNGTSSNSNGGKTVVPTTTKQPKATTTNTMNNTRKEASLVDEITVFSSSTTPSSLTNNDSAADQIYDLNSVVDDVSCFTCKKFNQESNNKLVECRKCTKWFHQQCHSPRIEDSQIETDSDKSLLSASSYFSQCQMCSQQQAESRRLLTDQTTDILTGDDSKSILVKKNSDESKSDVNSTVNNGVKGLAALANKFNSVPPKISSQLSEDNSNKANQDDLFKKFKQATTMGSAGVTVGVKKQLNGGGGVGGSSSANSSSCSMSSTVKKSVFNLNSNTLPLKSPNHLIATSTKK